MSLVYITYHNENIFNADAGASRRPLHNPRYVSKFRKIVFKQTTTPDVIEGEDGKKLLTSSCKSRNKTMGFAQTPLNPPCDFLRKHMGVRWQRIKEHVCPKGIRDVPPVPRLAPRNPVAKKPKPQAKCAPNKYFKGHKHRANFVAINIERMKTAKSKKPAPKYVDSPKGENHYMLPSGLMPQFVCSNNFGKVPSYLRSHKKLLQRLQAECAPDQTHINLIGMQKTQRDKCLTYLQMNSKELTRAERAELVVGLKENFSELFKAYNSMPLYTDTTAKKLRKGKLEKDLHQIEQDIELMESTQRIFISEY